MRKIHLFMDGDSICATWDDFENLQESPAGFGDHIGDAVHGLIASSTHPSREKLHIYAMAIVNYTGENMGASVTVRQNNNDKCDKFAIGKIKELLATSGLR